jgi:trimethylamine--corrinoid protein Co-methyltransferase
MTNILQVTLFSEQEVEILREKVLKLLWQKGATMDHPSVLKLLNKAGAQVDFDSKRVRFPRQFLEKVLEMVPKKITLAGIERSHDLQLPREDGTFHLRTGTGARCYLDPDTDAYRKTTIHDVVRWARLASMLDQVSFSAFPFPTDAPVETADIHALRAMLQNSQKHVWVQPYSGDSIQYLIEMATVVAGGEQALKSRPLVSFITCSLTPLDFKFMDLEIILKACRQGVPIHACSLPSAGGTAPITMPSLILLATAEILTMVAVAQVVQPGSPVIATPLIFTLDMQTGRSLQSSPEAMQGAPLAIEFIKRAYGLPTHTYGSGSDSPDVDSQSMSERSLLGILVAMAGADILGGAGQIEVASTISPVQLIIDNEIAGMVRRIISGFRIDNETMAWEDLLTKSDTGHFLETDHTLRHCRDAFRPRIFTRLTREIWTKQGKKDLITRGVDVYHSICEKARPKDLAEDVRKEMDKIVEAADRYCKK